MSSLAFWRDYKWGNIGSWVTGGRACRWRQKLASLSTWETHRGGF